MPQFAPGSLHTATVKFANQASVPFTYDVSFCLGANQTEVARKSFSVPGGQSLDVLFSITMPSAVGSYPVYIKVSSGGKLIATFTGEAIDIAPIAQIVTLSLVNYGSVGAPWPRWYIQMYSNNDLSKQLMPPLDDYWGVTKALDEPIPYTIPSNFVYPLQMLLGVQTAPWQVTNVVQSMNPYLPPAAWGVYKADFTIPHPGSYTINYQTRAIIEQPQGVVPFAIVFTSATISPFAVQAWSGWWGTSYYGVAQMSISWNAAHRVPEVEGSGSGSIQVSWQLTKGAAVVSGSYSTTPQAVDSAGKYYFPPGAGSVGWPYAGMQVNWADVNPERGVWNYVVKVKALDFDGTIVGEATFQGTVTVS